MCGLPGAVPVPCVLPAEARYLGFGSAWKAATDEEGGGVQRLCP